MNDGETARPTESVSAEGHQRQMNDRLEDAQNERNKLVTRLDEVNLVIRSCEAALGAMAEAAAIDVPRHNV